MRHVTYTNNSFEHYTQQRSINRVIQILESINNGTDKQNSSVKNSETIYSVVENVKSFNTERVYNIVWGKSNTKKHKTYECDGKLETNGTIWRLMSDTGTVVGESRATTHNLEAGSRIRIGNKEVEIVEEVHQAQPKTDTNIQPPRKKFKPTNNISSFSTRNSNSQPLIFPRPANENQWTNKKCGEVHLDSVFCRTLRPHQRDGVVFLYECVMGFRSPPHFGAILADEMGLGKTLQTIALIWTLLKQGPQGIVVCKRVLIIAPSSLCNNWEKEFTKWLGRERIKTYLVEKANKVKDFIRSPLTPVMIVSYEQFVRNFKYVEEIKFDLIVCDEGHRLKNSSVRAAQLLMQLNCKRRIILTGTPVQNNLQEYFNIINLVNPDILGSNTEFKINYESHIVQAQQPHCSDEEKHIAQEKSAELNTILGKFILRRTQDIMENYLPCKIELIVCCQLTPVQKDMYNDIIRKWFGSEIVNPFQAIATLRKICNHPCLVETTAEVFSESLVRSSSKISIIDSILKNIHKSNERIVLVSYSTKFLDILEKLCNMRGITFLRLDGTTPVSQRKCLVDSFNNKLSRVFLVSARAGGVGLNLTGASRLVLADGDWNPSNDQQALARIWRDGQKRSVTIYRLLCTGTIEEKIFQRQLSKLALGESVEDPDNLKTSLKFSNEELRDLFTPDFETDSIAHDQLMCRCHRDLEELGVNDEDRDLSSDNGNCENGNNQFKDWDHFCKPFTSEFLQDIMLQNVEAVTFIFKKITNPDNTSNM